MPVDSFLIDRGYVNKKLGLVAKLKTEDVVITLPPVEVLLYEDQVLGQLFELLMKPRRCLGTWSGITRIKPMDAKFGKIDIDVCFDHLKTTAASIIENRWGHW